MESVTLGLPLLSIFDPDGAGGISIDPLGLTPLGEQLSVELIPGVRERQTHPRYLTAIAVSHAVCDEFPPDTLASDEVSEPWQVFEWHVVEGLVRCAASRSEANVPGSQKAEKARRQGLPLSAGRYLKSPTIFGFHGVYRLLARTLRVEQADRLADFGFELLDVWQKERGLQGFYGSTEGPGKRIRRNLTEAVNEGLKNGTTACSNGWFGWQFFFEHLDPKKAGPKESQLIWRQLESGTAGYRKEVLEFVVSKDGQALFRTNEITEKKRYAALKRIASSELRARIETIQRYEAFCRLLLDAFEACRYEITESRRGIQPSRLGSLRAVAKAAELLPEAFVAAETDLGQSTRGAQFRGTFLDVSQKRTASDFVIALFEHHKRVQKAKPPEGKAPWLEQHFDGSLLIRPEYRLDKAPQAGVEFVNPYRLPSLWSFAVDLKQV